MYDIILVKDYVLDIKKFMHQNHMLKISLMCWKMKSL